MLVLAFTLCGSSSRASSDGLECKGHLVELGESQAQVLAECGPPQHILKAKRRVRIVDTWSYERPGSLPRLLQFRFGRLESIAAGSLFG